MLKNVVIVIVTATLLQHTAAIRANRKAHPVIERYSQASKPTTTTALSDKIYFETHGRDDIRQWDSQFLKGTHTMKVDFNFQPATDCEAQINLPPGYNFSQGCLLLAHWFDGTAAHNHYNTSYDIVSYFANPATQALLATIAEGEIEAQQQANRDPHSQPVNRAPVIIQICLKNPPPYTCDGQNISPSASTEAQQFIALLEEFFNLLQPVLRSSYNQTTEIEWTDGIPPPRTGLGNLIFVIDSFSYLNRECLAQRFWPWISTYVGGNESALSNSDNYDLFQMVNLADTDGHWDWLGAGNATAPVPWLNDQFDDERKSAWSLIMHDSPLTPFFKWNSVFPNVTSDYLRNTFPMIAYEPSDELEILLWYFSYAQYGYVHPGGVFIAYNPDPSNFHTYTAAATGRYSHFPFGSNQSITPVTSYAELTIGGQATSGFLFTAALIEADLASAEISLHQRGARGTFAALSTVRVVACGAQLLGGKLTSVQFLVSSSSSSAAVGTIVLTGKTGTLLSFDTAITFTVATFSMFSVKLSETITIYNLPAAFTEASFAWLASPPIAGASNTSASVTLSPIVAYYSRSLQTVVIAPLDPHSYQIVPNSPLLGPAVTAVSGAASLSGGWSFAVGYYTDQSKSEARVALSWSLNRNIYTVAGLRDLSADSTTGMQFTDPAHMGVGAAPSHSFNAGGNASFILVTYGDSFCYNSEMTDDDSLEFYGMMVCDVQDWPDFELSECPVQNYIFGRFDAFFAEAAKYGGFEGIRSPNAHTQDMINGKVDPRQERSAIRQIANELASESSMSVIDSYRSAKSSVRSARNRTTTEPRVDTPLNGFATACSAGSFDLLTNSSALLLHKIAATDTDIRDGGFLGVVVGSSLTVQSNSECGNPIPHNGMALVDSFPLFGFFNRDN